MKHKLPHNETLDSAIPERLKNGDERAFQEVYDLYHHKLFRYSLKFTHSEEATQEIIQDIFLKLWENRQGLKPHLSLQNYLYTLNKHENFKYLQQAARQVELQKEIIHRYEASRNSTEDEVIYDEYMEIAEEAIEQLSPQRQLIFKMSRYEGHSSKEIAEALGISNNTVRAQLAKATQHIKDYFYVHSDITLTIIAALVISLF